MKHSDLLLIAELSANHNQEKNLALETLHAAKESGANAVKLQTYTADTLTLDSSKPYFQIQSDTLWDGETLYSLYQKAYTPWEWHEELFEYAKKLGLLCFSTPFDPTAVDFLETLGNPIYKIASFEINDIPLIRYAARLQKPMILSTGIASLEEISEAVEACRNEGNEDITLLACTSSYPAPLEEANLARIPDLKRRFGVKVGLSDHTLGLIAPIVAVSLGASVIEKHFILSRSLGGPDGAFSLEPSEFKEMVSSIHAASLALGEANYELSPKVAKSKIFKRSLFVCEKIQKGERFTPKNLRSIRPGHGLPPKHLNEILGKEAACDIERGEPLTWEMVRR
ncbi:pseudaminic acid synthase [Wolinella succinogenes]|uniref:Pseudaminic acid synthase n=1 Tax=Wolinella succinogenes (strain ATCC 29543 / DSM 1740 / CCUG 13145 / JCM 31913 / LMG 7466 / NCTC 11488 / FDC 602W) TaxID=273121 RepID=Q7M7S8_WOLSU|nr:pseudaminic acid synthase [Wolinella succinogenes]CAE11107.1 SIALIC ACID SYNTHASE [Wolinella succinogenes]VEG81272.1 Spore coat polysaccharide biosynthesis protein spsE [Wolinella succinogenes]HCZ19166.1 pseudaminic acid synthase [Helicobacter sp.]